MPASRWRRMGIKLAGEPRVVLCTIGDASTRQGEFYEAVVQAVQDRLPIVFVVEDNGYGISTSTLDQLPFRLGIFNPDFVRHVDGRSVDAVAVAGSEAIAAARRGDGLLASRLESHWGSRCPTSGLRCPGSNGWLDPGARDCRDLPAFQL